MLFFLVEFDKSETSRLVCDDPHHLDHKIDCNHRYGHNINHHINHHINDHINHHIKPGRRASLPQQTGLDGSGLWGKLFDKPDSGKQINISFFFSQGAFGEAL